MALDKSICFNPAKNIYIQSGVHALPGKQRGEFHRPCRIVIAASYFLFISRVKIEGKV